MNKHAFLIIAHNEFEILQLLISSLDSEITDIYVHIDKKVKVLPKLYTQKSNLTIIENRIDVRWGHTSQIDCEMLLFECALKNSPYQHYHLISGTHLPLRPLTDIVQFYQLHEGEQILDLWETCTGRENIKLGRYNFWIKNFKCNSQLKQRIIQLIWTANLKIQKILHIYRFPDNVYIKASQWLSLTQDAVSFLIKNKEHIKQKYRFAFCPDEYFIPTELSNNGFRLTHFKKLLFQQWERESPRTLTEEDLIYAKKQGYMFARKFSSKNIEILSKKFFSTVY